MINNRKNKQIRRNEMELDKKTVRTIVGLIVLTLLLAAAIWNYTAFFGGFLWVIGLIFPFILGACMAFILNIPMSLIEKYLFSAKRVKGPRVKKLSRPVSMLLALMLLIVIIVVIMFLILPEIARTIVTLTESIPNFVKNTQEWALGMAQSYPDIANKLSRFTIDWSKFGSEIIGFLQKGLSSFVGSTFNVASSIASGMLNFFLGFIFAIYVLLQKEKLGSQCRKLFYAYLPEKAADKIVEVSHLANKTFSSFVTGQCTEAVILGVLFFIVLAIFQFPYALMISVLIGFLSLIPIFGAFVGCFIGGFLILMVSPVQALGFLIVFLVIQQIEGNFIYPFVVGGSVGLPSIWVLVAVAVGGSAMGITGMIITIPLTSVCYALLREATDKRLQKRTISSQKYMPRQQETI